MENSNLNISQIIYLIYFWAHEYLQKHAAHELQISRTTVTSWYQDFRDVCIIALENNPQLIGGIDENNDPIIVEIDESYFLKPKYNRGRYGSGRWVFGAVERDSGLCFLQTVENRTKATLEALIIEWILPGSHIISDGWAAYNEIETIHNGIYTHQVIIHSDNFVDPYDKNIHTQNIENLWSRVKYKFRKQYGTPNR